MRPVIKRQIYRVLLIVLLCSHTDLLAHKQHVHQYTVKEAYQLLRQVVGGDVPRLHDHIGDLTPFYAGDSAWQRPYVTTGAWREDEEDVVFGYSNISIGRNYVLVSITHFWDADDGDLTRNLFRVRPSPPLPAFNIGPYENAYDKLLRYANGAWTIKYPRLILAQNATNGHALILAPLPALPNEFGIPVSYETLTGFFQTRRLNLPSPGSGRYTVFDVIERRLIDPSEAPQIVIPEFEPAVDMIVWEVLGRMCHLLGDMSVPAHAHRDEHGLDPDVYEDWMGGPTYPYLVWDHQNVGPVVDPFNPDNDPLHYLMYTMQQQADHFGSNGPYEGDGNDIIGGNPRPGEVTFLSPPFLPSLGLPTNVNGPWTLENLENIRDKGFRYAVRATAGLLYWFARETGLIGPVGVRAGKNFPQGFALMQNYPNPFNPSTTIQFTIPVGTYGRTSLRVYDVLGREVATLVNEHKTPGRYEVEWNTEDAASGVYLYRLEAGNYFETRKMILLR